MADLLIDPDFPRRWWWLSSDGRAFSPAIGIVTPKNKAFSAWLATGHAPTPWPRDDAGVETDAALDDVLRPYGLRCSALTLAEARARARSQVIAFADQMTARITGQYPAAEVAAWPTQEAEARAIKAGSPEIETPLINALADGFALTRAAIADIVLAKATLYRQIIAAVIVTRDAAVSAINAAEDVPGIDAALAAVKVKANALATQLGLG